MADGGERTRIPAWPYPDVLRDLMGEGEVEVLGAQRRPGDTLDLLQHPGPDVGIGGRARADRLPRPGQLDMRQPDVDPDHMQGRGERRQHRPGNHLTEYQAGHDQDRRRRELARDAPPRAGPDARAIPPNRRAACLTVRPLRRWRWR